MIFMVLRVVSVNKKNNTKNQNKSPILSSELETCSRIFQFYERAENEYCKRSVNKTFNKNHSYSKNN